MTMSVKISLQPLLLQLYYETIALDYCQESTVSVTLFHFLCGKKEMFAQLNGKQDENV